MKPRAQTLFTVGPKEVKICYDFAVNMCQQKAATDKNFGQEPRTQHKYIANHILGKAAEIAFQQFLAQHYALKAEIDWDIRANQSDTDDGNEFERYELDGVEISAQSKLDVKASNASAQWLLVEESKIFRRSNYAPADFFVGVSWDNSNIISDFIDHPENVLGNSMSLLIRGFAHKHDLVDSLELQGWIEFPRGDRLINARDLLPIQHMHRIANKNSDFNAFRVAFRALAAGPRVNRIGPKLDNTRNVGLPYSWLRSNNTDWDRMISRLIGEDVHMID